MSFLNSLKTKANVALGSAVRATTLGVEKAKAFNATPEGKLAKVAVCGVYVGYALGALAQRVMEEV